MTKVRVAGFSVSLDGFGAGPEQSLENPLGQGGMEIHRWALHTKAFKSMLGQEGGSEGTDNDYAARAMTGFGAFIMGRNMFGPERGPWKDEEWKGWWGDNPPYHAPVFVLTHFAREPIEMKGGTTFYFVASCLSDALGLARAAAGERDVKIAGGPATVREYLRLGAIDELHLAFAPVFLGRGEQLLEDIDLPALGYQVTQTAATDDAMHVVLSKGP
jgi:dihydrofolate reductase